MVNWDYIKYELREQWRRLAIRQRINEHPRQVIIATCLCALVLLVVVISLLSPERSAKPKAFKKAWFYDLNTGRLFTDRYDKSPPVKAPSGPLPDAQPSGVKAYLLTYVEEPNESQRFIGFLETTDPNAGRPKAPAGEPTIDKNALLTEDTLIRTIDDANWVPANSTKGRSIIKEAFRPNKDGRYPRYWLPE